MVWVRPQKADLLADLDPNQFLFNGSRFASRSRGCCRWNKPNSGTAKSENTNLSKLRELSVNTTFLVTEPNFNREWTLINANTIQVRLSLVKISAN